MDETKRCPMCAEEILAAAVKCKHCGSELASKPPASAARIAGVLFFALLTAWIAVKCLAGWGLAAADRINYLVPAWNTLIFLGMVVICIGLLVRAEWARDWATGTAALAVVSDVMNLGNTLLSLVGVVIGGIAVVCLAMVKREFIDEAAEDPEDVRTHRPRSRREVYLTVGLVAASLAVSLLAESKKPPAVADTAEEIPAWLKGKK